MSTTNDNQSESDNSKQFNILKSFIEKFDILSLQPYLINEKQSSKVLDMLISFTLQYLHQNTDDSYKIIELLLQNGANIDTPIHLAGSSIEEKENITLLMYSLLSKDINLFRIVIKYKPDVSLRDAQKRNAILYFVLYNVDENVEMLESLIKLKADVNSNANVEFHSQEYEWHSVFTIACLQQMKRTIKVLIDNNVDVNYVTFPSKNTGLHYSLLENYKELTMMLIKINGIRLDIANSNGEKAIDIASQKGDLSMFMNQNNRVVLDENDKATNDGVNENISVYSGAPVADQQHNNNQNNQVSQQLLQQHHEFDQFKKMQLDQQHHIINHEPIITIRKSKTNNTNNTMNNNNNYNSNNNSNNNNKITSSQYNHNHNYYFNKGRRNLLFHRNKIQIPIQSNPETQAISPAADNTIDAFIKISNPPMLCLDLSSITIDLEAKVTELTIKLQEEEKILKNSEDSCIQYTKKLYELEKSIADKEIEFSLSRKISINNYNELYDAQTINSLLNNEFNSKPPSSEYIIKKYADDEYNKARMIHLIQKDLEDYCALNKNEIDSRKIYVSEVVESIQLIVNEINPDYEVILYGSYSTGLCLPWSDIDLVLSNKAGKAKQNNYLLGQLYKKLITKKWVKDPKYIETTAIPIIKLISTQKSFQFKIDISIKEENHMGLKCVDLVKDYMKEYPVLEPIVLALKTMLQEANLNNPYKGGLSSYGTILMVVSYIQNQMKGTGDINQVNEPYQLGKTFIGFLEYFSITFDYSKYLILTYSIEENLKVDSGKTDIVVPTYNSYGEVNEFVIVDPLNKKNNVAKSTHQYVNIKLAFLLAYLVTREGCECGCHYGGAVNKNDYCETEHCILKRMFNSVRRCSDENN